MIHKASTLSMEWMEAKRASQARQRIFIFVLSLVAVFVAVSAVYLFVSYVGSDVSTATANGLAADSARWTALAEQHKAEIVRAERSADASTTRWSALAGHYKMETQRVERSNAANSARWNALSAEYAGRQEAIVDASIARYEEMARYYGARHVGEAQGAAADTARWNALAGHYKVKTQRAERSNEASSARWNALSAHYRAREEAIIAASAARYEAMGRWYASEVAVKE